MSEHGARYTTAQPGGCPQPFKELWVFIYYLTTVRFAL